MSLGILANIVMMKNITKSVKETRNKYLENRFKRFIEELEVADPTIVSLIISNLSNEFKHNEFEQILYSSIEQSRSDYEAKSIAKILLYSGEVGDPSLFLPMVAAIEKLLPGDLVPLVEGYEVHKKMKSEGLYDGAVHAETRRLRELFSKPGIKQRYFSAGLSVIAPELGQGDIKLSNELPPHLINALELK